MTGDILVDETRRAGGAVGGQAPATHRTRRTMLEKEAAWTLEEQGIERTAAGESSRHIPFSEIAEIRLSYDPTRFESSRYRCDVTTRSGTRELIVSVSYVSPANFENRAETYVPFVRALTRNVSRANPACRFIAGKKPLTYFGEHAFLLAMLLLLASTLYLTGVPVAGVVAIKLALIAIYVPVMLRYTRVNRPRRFDPENIPSDALPGEG